MPRSLAKPARVVDEKLLEEVRARPCIVCGRAGPSDPSHVRSRGAGGPDSWYNVVAMCRTHHNQWHSYGPHRFFSAYPGFALQLEDMGWTWGRKSPNGRLWHPMLLAAG